MSKYGVISGPYFPVFSPNTGKYGPEITPYVDTFHAVLSLDEPSGNKTNNIWDILFKNGPNKICGRQACFNTRALPLTA